MIHIYKQVKEIVLLIAQELVLTDRKISTIMIVVLKIS